MDLVVVNGVLGRGIDTAAEAKAALTATARAMRNGGTLAVGRNEGTANDTAGRRDQRSRSG